VALVGPPNAGKSALVRTLTHAEPEVAPYPFTTREAVPGMLDFEDVAFQLIDLPPVCEEHVEPWVWDVIRGADLAWMVLSIERPLEGLELALGLTAAKALVLSPWDDVPSEDLRPGWTYKPTLMVVTGMDRPGARGDLGAFEELAAGGWPKVAVSVESGEGLDELGRRTFEALGVIRVYSKEPGRDPDRERPFTLPRGATVADLTRKIHKELASDFAFARIWGPSTFDGQRVPDSHVLEEGDVVEIHS
jgi:ribosome-interacting GTPase 1